MNALNQILSQIRKILGLSTSIRSTTQSVKRESDYISKGIKRKERTENNN